MLPAMKVNENYRIITLQQRNDTQELRRIEASLVKKTGRTRIGRPSTYAPTISTIIRNYVEKGNLTVRNNYTQLVLQSEN
jgi:DNA topoisomerase-1